MMNCAVDDKEWIMAIKRISSYISIIFEYAHLRQLYDIEHPSWRQSICHGKLGITEERSSLPHRTSKTVQDHTSGLRKLRRGVR